jgi:hypothetical protein
MADDLKVGVSIDTSQFESGLASMRRGINGFGSDLVRAMNSGRRAVSDAAQILNRLDLAQVTVQQSIERVNKAQERYAEAVAKSGPASEAAGKAAEDLAKAQDALDQAQQRSALSAGLVVAQSAQLAARLPAAVAGMRALATAQITAATAAGALSSAMTMGAAAIGIVAGIAAIKAAIDSAATSYEFAEQKAAEWGTAQMLAALKSREAALMAEETSVTDYNLFDPRTWASSSRSLNEIQQDLRNVRGDVLQNEFAITQAVRESANAFLEAEDIKAQVAAKNEPVIRAQLAKTLEDITNARAALLDPFTPTADLAGLQKSYSDAVSNAERLKAALTELATEAQRGIEAQAQATRNALTNGLQGLAVNLQALSANALASLSALDGPLAGLAAGLAATKAQESLLATAALKSSKALRDQAEITADKDETTEEFHKRLLDLGFAEEEIAKRVDETGRALLRQTEATNKAASAADRASGNWRSGVMEGTGNSFGGGHDIGGHGAPGSKFGLQAFLEVNRENLISKLYGFPLGSFEYNVNNGKLFNSAGIMNLLRGQGERDSTDNIVGARTFNMPGFKDLVKQLILTTAPATQWDSMLKELGVPHFANGFDGVVNRASLFVAGEAGPERVTVSPTGRGGGAPVIHINVYAQDGRDAGDQIARRLKGLGVFGSG